MMTRMPRSWAASRESLEILESAVAGMNGGVVGDVVAVVAQRRREKRHQPHGIDPQLLQVVELLREAPKIADAVAVGVVESADVDLVDDGVLVPELVLRRWQVFFSRNCHSSQNDRTPSSVRTAAGDKNVSG